MGGASFYPRGLNIKLTFGASRVLSRPFHRKELQTERGS